MMAKARHRKKKPLAYRVGVPAMVLSTLAGIGFWSLLEEDSTPSREEVIASEVSLPLTPAGRDANIDDSTEDLCESFEAAGQTCRVTYAYSSSPNGTLIFQSPEAGVESQTVTLGYSRGPRIATVPILAGLSLKDAELLLWKTGLKASKVKTVDAPAAKGTVVRSSKEPSSTASNGTGLVIFTSTGLIKTPNWVGKPQELVEAEANALGLKVTVRYEDSSEISGIVIRQEKSGKRVPFNSSIVVTVARAESSSEVELPDVVGLSQTEAISLLASKGFLKITTVIVGNGSSTAKVQTMSPSAGSSANVTDEIRLTLTTS